MGSKGGTTQQTSSSSGPPPQVMAEYQSLVDRATNAANQPYQPYQGEMVAPLSSQTLTGLGGINQYAGAAQPYLQGAGMMTLGASGGVTPAQYQGMGSLAPFMNPYTSSVVGTTEAEMQNQNQQQAQFLNSANISSGAFGGDRAGIGQSILANQQQLAEAPTIAGLNQANYQQAMQNWQQQQGVNLAAQQWNQNQAMTGAAQLGQIGMSAQEAGLQGAQTQIQAGTIPQQEQQAIDQAAMQQYQTGQAYPFTTTGWLGNIIEGTGSLSGGTSQTTSPGPNSITQGLGLATQGIGLMGSLLGLSDVRAKENIEEIGKTYDDQPIYRYNFRGDPRTQIGLLAQEEAYHDPGSVQRIGMGDLLGIDYESATDEAAERGHFQYGGAPTMGGAQMMGAMGGMGGMGGLGGGGSGSVSPTMDLMYMGDPGARMGFGSLGLASGAQMHPHEDSAGFQISEPSGAVTPPMRQPPAAQMQPASKRSSIPQGLPSLWSGGRAGFQSGGNTQQIYAEYGLDPSGNAPNTWSPGQELPANAGQAAALWDIESGGKYTGVDESQTTAIGQGQWMPPATTNLTPSGPGLMPNWQDPGASPQYGAAEASLAGLFGGGYTPGQVPGYQQPSTTTPTQGTQPSGGSSGDQLLGQMMLQDAMGAGGNTPGLSHQFQEANALLGNPNQGAPRPWQGDTAMFGTNNNPGGMQSVPPKAAGGRIGEGGTNVNGRGGFQGGGAPGFYTPTTGVGRNATWNPPPAIAVQRQLQGRARAQVAAARGMTRPMHIVRTVAPDPVTGDLHDMHRPLSLPMMHDRPPFGSGPYDPPNSLHGPAMLPGKPMQLPGYQPPEPVGTVTQAPKDPAFPLGGGPTEETPPERVPTKLPSDPVDPSLLPGSNWRQNLPPGWQEFPSGDVGPANKPAVEDPGYRTRLPMTPPQVVDRLPTGLVGEEESLEKGREGLSPGDGLGPDIERFRGGRIGYQDGGDTRIGDMSDEDVGRLLGDQIWSGDISPQMPSDADFGGVGTGTSKLQINPGSVAAAPTFQGGGGGGGVPRGGGIVTNFMGGPPITAANFTGHYAPTTGNARGATFIPGAGGVSPNATAQAPEHPAITIARRIHGAGYAAGHAAGRRMARAPVDTSYGPQLPGEYDEYGYGIGVNRPGGAGGASGSWARGGAVGYQGGGGVMGSSPMMNAGGYTPQGFGLSGQTSQGEGLGSFATSKAASGFGDLFGGGGRQGFADGGSGIDPFLASIEAASQGGTRGPGPPQAPQAAQQPQGGGGPQIPKDLGQDIKQIGQGVQNALGGGNQPTGGDDLGGGLDSMQGANVGPLVDDAFSFYDSGFQTGGGVGLGSLRRPFRAEGGASADSSGGPPSDSAIEAALDPFGGANEAPAPAPARGGGGGGGGTAPNLSYFGDRAGYAGTISKLESNMGKSYVGDGGSSFGPFQLHYGGINKDMPNPGLGEEFTRATGLDARDPSTVDAQSKFVADYTAKHGWGAWSTKAQADKIAAAGGADVPAAGAQPAQATTEGYGGGFAIPPGGAQPPPPPQQSHPPTMGDELRRDPFGYMMTVGAAMAASRSPWLGVGIGEGLVAGNKYLNSMQAAEREWGVNQAQIQNLTAEAREHGADADLKSQQVIIAQRMAQIQIAAFREAGIDVGGPSPTEGSGQPPAPVKPVSPAAPAAPAGAPPTGGAKPSGPQPSGPQPSGPQPTPTAPGGPQTDPTAAPPIGGYTSDPNYIEGLRRMKLGAAMNIGGGTAGNAYIDQGKAMIDAAKAEWEKRVAPTVAGQEEEQKGYVTQRNEENEEVADRVGGLKTEVQSLEALRELMKRVPTGWATSNFADAQNVLATFGIHVGNPAEVREFIKYTTSDIWNNLKEQKGAVRNKEMDAASKMNVDPDAPPAANAEILAKQLGLARFQLQYANDYNKWDEATPGNVSPTRFKTKWMLDSDLDKSVDNERKNIAYQKQAIPQKGQYVPGQLYMLPNGQTARAKDASTMIYE